MISNPKNSKWLGLAWCCMNGVAASTRDPRSSSIFGHKAPYSLGRLHGTYTGVCGYMLRGQGRGKTKDVMMIEVLEQAAQTYNEIRAMRGPSNTRANGLRGDSNIPNLPGTPSALGFEQGGGMASLVRPALEPFVLQYLQKRNKGSFVRIKLHK